MLNSRKTTLLITFVLFQCSNALYFHIGETERKCFIEEIPDETNVIGKLKTLPAAPL